MSVKTTHIDGDVSVGRDVYLGGKIHVSGREAHFHGNVKIDGWLESKNIKDTNKGLYGTYAQLHTAYPEPKMGWWALVGHSLPAQLYMVEKVPLTGALRWVGQEVDGEPVMAGAPVIELTEIEGALEGAERRIDDLETEVEVLPMLTGAVGVTDIEGIDSALGPDTHESGRMLKVTGDDGKVIGWLWYMNCQAGRTADELLLTYMGLTEDGRGLTLTHEDGSAPRWYRRTLNIGHRDGLRMAGSDEVVAQGQWSRWYETGNEGLSEKVDRADMVVISAGAYEALEEKDNGKFYFVYEDD